MSNTAETPDKNDLNEMLNFLMEFAKLMVKEHGGFYPFGAGMDEENRMTSLGLESDTDYPASKDVLALVHSALVKQATAGEIKASGICMDVHIVPPGSEEPSDAICVELEHESGEAVHVFLPYSIDASRTVTFGEMFATPGEQTIFVPIAG